MSTAPEVVILDDDEDKPERPQLAVFIQDQLHCHLGAVKAELNTEKEGHQDARETVYAQHTLTEFERAKYDSLLELCKQSRVGRASVATGLGGYQWP